MTTIALQCDLKNQKTRCFWRQQSSCLECMMYKGRSRRPHNGREVALRCPLRCPLCCPLPVQLPGLLQVELFLQTQSRLFQILTGSNSRGELGSRSPTFLSWRKNQPMGLIRFQLPTGHRGSLCTKLTVSHSSLHCLWNEGLVIWLSKEIYHISMPQCGVYARLTRVTLYPGIQVDFSHSYSPMQCLNYSYQVDFASAASCLEAGTSS